MCGIAGLYDRRGRADLGRLQRMTALLRHRGPDDEGLVLIDPRDGSWQAHGGPDTPADVFVSGLRYAPGSSGGAAGAANHAVALAHRRLAIVDLKPSGHQPMCDAGGGTWITYNGEIYNHPELREELAGRGHRFVSTSDTEVILAAWKEWGEDCLRHFNGMFALALWDSGRRALFCARDRLGVKPFHYQFDGVRFAFASDPRSLALTQQGRINPHLPAIHDLLALDWVDTGAQTFLAGVATLPAGHFLVLGEEGFRVRRWWGIDPGARATGTPADREREFAGLFTDSVRLRLRADVEVGSCLSGGLDSSAVITTAGRLANRGLHAFSCAYDEGPAFDERPWIRVAVEASGATSHLTVPDGQDFWKVFDAMADGQSEPTAGPGVYSQWKVMQLAHGAGLKVLLDGQGGDEILAGYFRYLPVRLRDFARTGDLAAFRALWGPVADRLGVATTLLHTFEPWLPAPLVRSLRGRFGQGKDRVLSRALARVGSDAPARPAANRSELWRSLAFDTLTRQLPGLLRYEDRNSMAFAIETRLPFLDYRLVEYAFSLPDDEKLDGVTTKAILRRALADRIPPSVLARRDKMGFETPSDTWLRGPYAAEVRRRLSRPGPMQDWVETGVLRQGVEDYLSGRRAIGLQIWRWLSLEAWSQAYFAADPRVVARTDGGSVHAGGHIGVVEQQARIERETAAGAARS